MLKQALGIIVGFIAWTALWLAGNAVGRAVAPNAYDETGLTTDTALLAAILVLSLFCSLGAGLLWRAIAGRGASIAGAWTLAIVLLLVGVMVQASVWNQMPLWYHLTFLALLLPATLAGASIVRTPKAP